MSNILEMYIILYEAVTAVLRKIKNKKGKGKHVKKLKTIYSYKFIKIHYLNNYYIVYTLFLN